MKQKLRVTITTIRRQTTLSGDVHGATRPPIPLEADDQWNARAVASLDLETSMVADPISDRNIREINASTMPDDQVSPK